MNWDTLQQLVRIVMQIVAGVLLSRGWITEDMVTGLVGAVVIIAGIGWWALWDRNRQAPATPDGHGIGIWPARQAGEP